MREVYATSGGMAGMSHNNTLAAACGLFDRDTNAALEVDA
jgi:hypothetical protein